MIKAEIILIRPDESLNFFVRKSGMVNESYFSVSSLKRSAIKNQEDIIPIVIPITAHISPYPIAIAAPGSPRRSHADSPEALSEKAVTHGPSLLPANKKSNCEETNLFERIPTQIINKR